MGLQIIKDLTPLAALKHLNKLYLCWSLISDLTPLAELKEANDAWPFSESYYRLDTAFQSDATKKVDSKSESSYRLETASQSDAAKGFVFSRKSMRWLDAIKRFEIAFNSGSKSQSNYRPVTFNGSHSDNRFEAVRHPDYRPVLSSKYETVA